MPYFKCYWKNVTEIKALLKSILRSNCLYQLNLHWFFTGVKYQRCHSLCRIKIEENPGLSTRICNCFREDQDNFLRKIEENWGVVRCANPEYTTITFLTNWLIDKGAVLLNVILIIYLLKWILSVNFIFYICFFFYLLPWDKGQS